MAKGDKEDNFGSLNDWESPEGQDAGSSRDSVDLGQCPYCKKAIYIDADVCPHCGSYVRRDEAFSGFPWWMWVGLVLAALAVVTWILCR